MLTKAEVAAIRERVGFQDSAKTRVNWFIGIADALALIDTIEAFAEALKRIRAEVGIGAKDVVEANFKLGRIDQHARHLLDTYHGEAT